MTDKVCGHCKTLKKIEEFSRNKNRPDGHQDYCKSCISVMQKDFRTRLTVEQKKHRLDYNRIGLLQEDPVVLRKALHYLGEDDGR